MSEPHVTITLGRSGQVVTKGGRKRSRGDGDHVSISTSKRFQGNGLGSSPGLDNANGSHIARNDLRLKLMRKGLSKQVHYVVEGREKMQPIRELSRSIQHPPTSYIPSHRPDSSASNRSRQVLPGELHPVESLGKFHASQTVPSRHNQGKSFLGGSRARSPDRIWRNSIAISPPRRYRTIRAADIPRSGRYMSVDVPDVPRASASTPIMLKATSSAGNLVTRPAPPSGAVQKAPPPVEEHITVSGFLHSLDLGKYAVLFQAEEVDMTVLKQMGDKDLKDMGIPMGPRKKILLALLPRQKRQTSSLQN